ncbi:MAG: SulP family inorganic anion transporter [Acidimicrobiales bacterium]
MIAGMTVGAIVVPQSLAYADLAGMPAVTGLYAAMAAMAAYALLGSSPVSSLGPTATSAILAAATVTALSDATDATTTVVLPALAVTAGGLALAAGLARLGFVANLLSRPVLTGYAAGAAVVITVGQLGDLVGVPLGVDVDRRAPPVVDVLGDLPGSLDDASAATLAVGTASIVALVLLGLRFPRLPAALVVVAGAIVAAGVLDLADHGVAVAGDVPRGLPDVAVPKFSALDAGGLLAAAAAMTLVGFAETLAQGRALARASDPELAPNRELVALGAANVASGLCGALPVSASFSRTAVNRRAGGRTRRAGAVTAAAVALCLVALTGVVERLPQATLAAVIVVAVVPLVPLRTFRRLARLQRDDFVMAVVAAAGTVVLGIIPGLAIAVALSIGGLLYRVTATDTAVLGYVPDQDAWRSLDRFSDARTAPEVVVLRFSGPLYFANAARLHREVAGSVAEASPHLQRVVLDGRAISHLDVTALDTLAHLHTKLAEDGVDLVVAGLRGTALDTLLRSELAQAVGADRLVFPTVRAATGT